MVIKGANVFLPTGGFKICDVTFTDRIVAVGSDYEDGCLNGEGCYLIPGLIDIHTHGAMGADASDGSKAGLKVMAAYYAKRGVTSFCATTMTLPEKQLARAMEVVRDFRKEEQGANCIGAYLEGPFLSVAKKGAQNAEYLQKPDYQMLQRLNAASGGKVKLCGVAPEELQDDFFIEKAKQICTVSLAHSTADYEMACKAFDAGASQATHLFNGMNPYAHRAPGIIGAAMDKGAFAELICDGFHIHPSVIRGVFRMFRGRVILISDSLRCAGMPDGKYELGGQSVYLSGGVAKLSDGTIAGSCISLMDALRNVVAFGIPIEEAVRAATQNPAMAVGLDNEIGCIAPGAWADMVLLDANLSIKAIFTHGKLIG